MEIFGSTSIGSICWYVAECTPNCFEELLSSKLIQCSSKCALTAHNRTEKRKRPRTNQFQDPSYKRNQGEKYKEELEERIISLTASLFDGLSQGSRKDRLLTKFVEKKFEKVDRLMELYIRYADQAALLIEVVKSVDMKLVAANRNRNFALGKCSNSWKLSSFS